MPTGFTSNTRAFLPYGGYRSGDRTPSHIQFIQLNLADLEFPEQRFSLQTDQSQNYCI